MPSWYLKWLANLKDEILTRILTTQLIFLFLKTSFILMLITTFWNINNINIYWMPVRWEPMQTKSLRKNFKISFKLEPVHVIEMIYITFSFSSEILRMEWISFCMGSDFLKQGVDYWIYSDSYWIWRPVKTLTHQESSYTMSTMLTSLSSLLLSVFSLISPYLPDLEGYNS